MNEYQAKIVRGSKVLHQTESTLTPYKWAHVQGRIGFDVVNIRQNGDADLLDHNQKAAVLRLTQVVDRSATNE